MTLLGAKITRTHDEYYSIGRSKAPGLLMGLVKGFPTRMRGVQSCNRYDTRAQPLFILEVYLVYSFLLTRNHSIIFISMAHSLRSSWLCCCLAAPINRFRSLAFDRCVCFCLSKAGYLFPGIAKRRNAYLEANPDCRNIISLGIGDTTQVKGNC